MALIRFACLVAVVAAFAPSRTDVRAPTRRSLFGGGKKEGGGALSNVAGVMDQFKKAQEIAKKSADLQAELSKTEFEGTNEEASGKAPTHFFSMSGQQVPSKARVEGFDGMSAEELALGYADAMKDAQSKSLMAMNEKMQDLYAAVGLGAPPGM